MNYKDKFITRKIDPVKNCWVYWFEGEWRSLDQLFNYGKEIGICKCKKTTLSTRLSSFFTGNENGVFQSVRDCFQEKISKADRKNPVRKKHVTTDKPGKIEFLELMSYFVPTSGSSDVR